LKGSGAFASRPRGRGLARKKEDFKAMLFFQMTAKPPNERKRGGRLSKRLKALLEDTLDFRLVCSICGVIAQAVIRKEEEAAKEGLLPPASVECSPEEKDTKG